MNRWRLPLIGLLAGVAIALAWGELTGQVDENSETIERLDRQDRRIARNVRALRRLERVESEGRGQVVRIFCVELNEKSAALRGLIVSGARSSAIFEPLFETYGAPPLEARIRKAQRDAAKLADLDCDELVQLARTGQGWSRANP